MKSLLRHIPVALLALLIGFTSIQFAAARGQSPAVGTMEICTGTGPVHILVDENGEPTGAVMICPDYAVAFFADVWGEVPKATLVLEWQDAVLPYGKTHGTTVRLPSAQARGPPAAI